MNPQLISIQHRLAGRSGHRFNQALGCQQAAASRGLDPVLFLNADAEPEVRAAFPDGLAVLRDPVFHPDWSFDRRTATFVAMLHEHVSPLVERDDRVLMTTATQCEARALTLWLAELLPRRRPWVLVLFPADRWNRKGPEERARQVAEFAVLAADLARLAGRDPDVLRRLLFASHTTGLVAELRGLLATEVLLAPLTEVDGGLEPSARTPSATPTPPIVTVVGGARPEKGSHLLPAIVAACRTRVPGLDFLIQMHNETLAPEDFAALCALAGEPGVTAVHGAPDHAGYTALLTGADLMLLPYDRIPYRQRPSGILSEAVLAGLPVVVPANTWLGEQVESGAAAGVTYSGTTPSEIADALAAAVADLPALREAARLLAPRWRERNSIGPFLDWFQAEIAEIAARQAGEPGAYRSFSRRLSAWIRSWARG